MITKRRESIQKQVKILNKKITKIDKQIRTLREKRRTLYSLLSKKYRQLYKLPDEKIAQTLYCMAKSPNHITRIHASTLSSLGLNCWDYPVVNRKKEIFLWPREDQQKYLQKRLVEIIQNL